MKKKFFYAAVLVFTALLCFPGCNESSSTESTSGKRALEEADESSSGNNVQTAVTTTLTPLQTFARITAIDKSRDEARTEEVTQTEKAQKSETTVKPENEKSDWFEQNKLFDIKLQEDDSSDSVVTWYQFPESEETTQTAISVTEAEADDETNASMIIRSAEDFAPGE